LPSCDALSKKLSATARSKMGPACAGSKALHTVTRKDLSKKTYKHVKRDLHTHQKRPTDINGFANCDVPKKKRPTDINVLHAQTLRLCILWYAKKEHVNRNLKKRQKRHTNT